MASVLLFSSLAFGGRVRTIHTNKDSMKHIHLQMGQSTVVRFTEKPVKVVIGNQNFYSVEFVENDVTIQPLGAVRTNLFIYTPNHVYGFILNSKHSGIYDDIVNVKWVSAGFILKEKPRKKAFIEKKISKILKVKKIEVRLDKVIINKDRGTHIIDFQVTNHGSEKLKEQDINFYLTRSKKNLAGQEYALRNSVILPGKTVEGRILVKLVTKKGFTFNIKHQKDNRSLIISRPVSYTHLTLPTKA